MQKNIIQWPASNYEIQLTVTSTELEKAKTQAIKQFQKDMELPWFRKWFVPINIVEKNINPEYLQMWIYEEVVNVWIQETLKENAQIKFIGEPYDFNQKKEDQDTIITLKLDAYPEVQITDPNRKDSPIDSIDVQVSQEEIDNAITSIQKNYADYQDVNTISLDTVSKIFVEYLDQESNVLDKSNIYIWEQEFAENKFFPDNFLNKTKEQDFTISYDTKSIPTLLINQKKDLNIQHIKFIIKDIKKIVLPELNTTTIEKLFGKESEVKTYEQLLQYIQNEITKQKSDNTLMQNIDKFLQTIQAKYMNVSIPQTLINEEFKVRLKSFEDRFGWEEKLNQYYSQIWDEKKNEMLQEIKKSSKLSLEKFFILQKITEELWINIDRQNSKNLEVEKMIYQKLSTKEQSSDIAKPSTKEKKENKAPKSKTSKANQ
jgi:trigger factor